MDLANSKDRHSALPQYIQQHRPWRLHRIVVAAFRAPKTPRRARKWPGDHAPAAVRSVPNLARDFAVAIEPHYGNDLLVRGNLQNAVARRVRTRVTRAHVRRSD